MEDRFYMRPNNGSKNWFKEFSIPYSSFNNFKIVQRKVFTAESLLGGLNSKQLNQPNNIHITYSENGSTIVLRLEMLTGDCNGASCEMR